MMMMMMIIIIVIIIRAEHEADHFFPSGEVRNALRGNNPCRCHIGYPALHI
jgi:hypothetical protein